MDVKSNCTEIDPYQDKNNDVAECLHVWEKMRGAKAFPLWSEFDWMAFPVSIIPYFLICDVTRKPLDFVYRFWGTANSYLFHHDYTKKSVRDIRPKAVGEGLFAQYEKALERRKPVQFFFEMMGGVDGDTPANEVSLRLPFSDDGVNIDKILSFSDPRRNAEEFSKFFEKYK